MASEPETPVAEDEGDDGKSEFSEFNLQIGARLQVVLGRGANLTYFTTLVGYSAGEFVLIKAPIERGLPISLQEGETMTVRIFSGINVVSFPCQIERVFNAFYGCVQLSYPASVTAIRLRKAMRVRVALPVQINLAADDGSAARQVAGTLQNLSTTGGLIEAGEKLGTPEQQVDLAFSFQPSATDEQVQIEVQATIRSTRTLNPGRGQLTYMYGVEFAALEASKQILLQNLLYELVIANRLAVV